MLDSRETEDPVEIASRAMARAETGGYDAILIDTAGRLQIDEELMDELARLKAALRPHHIIFVADAMTGQEAVNVAAGFHERLEISGVILTKLDSDARGGAALSVRAITGAPISVRGTGEKIDAFEVFHPDRLASRILGMGDMLTLIEKAQQNYDQTKAKELERKFKKNEFTITDFAEQLKTIKKMGSLGELMGMIPGFKKIAGHADSPEAKQELRRIQAIIDSMTRQERGNHHDYQRPAPGANRQRQRHVGAGRQSLSQAVRADAQNDEENHPHGCGKNDDARTGARQLELSRREQFRMALVIRLAPAWRRKKPFYRIVVADSRSPRDGRFVAQVGTYDPAFDPPQGDPAGERSATSWLKAGAKPSDTVRKLIKRAATATVIRLMRPAATEPAMKELVQFLAQQLVNNPGRGEVKETQGDTASVLELRVAKEDLGRVIGKQGRTAKSIRTILNAVASRTNRKVVLEIIEDKMIVAARVCDVTRPGGTTSMLRVGRITGTHGLKGALRFQARQSRLRNIGTRSSACSSNAVGSRANFGSRNDAAQRGDAADHARGRRGHRRGRGAQGRGRDARG